MSGCLGVEERKVGPGLGPACVKPWKHERVSHEARLREQVREDSLGLQMKDIGARSKKVFAGYTRRFEFSCCKWLGPSGVF